MRSNSTKGITAALLGGIFWGLAGVSGQCLTQNVGCSAEWTCCCKMLIAGFVMLVAAFIQHRKHFLDIFKNKKDCIQLIIFAICGMMLCQYTFFKTVEMSNSATAVTLQYLCPILILIYTSWKEKERPQPRKVICILLAFFGVVTLVTHLKINSLALSPRVVICGFLSAVTYAIYSVQPKGIIEKYGVLLMNGYALFLGGLFMIPIVKPWNETVNLGFEGCIAFVLIVFGGTLFANLIYQTGVKDIGPQKANLIACVEPISVVVVSALWLKNRFLPTDLLGFVCIITAVICLSVPRANVQ